MIYFAVVVDNEVADVVAYDENPVFEKALAITRSGPIFVEIPAPVAVGSTYDGSTFTPPA
jgi:hypothetical protein